MSPYRSLYTSTRSLSPRPSSPSSPRTFLLTLDAFGTLFHPREPVPAQYAAVAHEHGLSKSAITADKIQVAFKEVFCAQAARYPNYGRADVLRGVYGGPRQWWAELMQNTFARALAAAEESADNGNQHNQEGNVTLPPGLVDTLLFRFAGEEGYALYPDITPFFARMRELKQKLRTCATQQPFNRVLLGVISNSDDRVPAVLKAFGLRVGDLRADQDRSSMALSGFEERGDVTTNRNTVPTGNNVGNVDREEPDDLDFIITSYEAGEEKPNRLIFDVARRQAQLLTTSHTSQHTNTTSSQISAETCLENWVCVHVGDDYEKDYRAAIDAGWESYLLPRAEEQCRPDARSISSLMGLFEILGIDS